MKWLTLLMLMGCARREQSYEAYKKRKSYEAYKERNSALPMIALEDVEKVLKNKTEGMAFCTASLELRICFYYNKGWKVMAGGM